MKPIGLVGARSGVLGGRCFQLTLEFLDFAVAAMALGQDCLDGGGRLRGLLASCETFQANADGRFDRGLAGRGFQQGLIAGSHAVKTPALDRRSCLDGQARGVDTFDLGHDRGGQVACKETVVIAWKRVRRP